MLCDASRQRDGLLITNVIFRTCLLVLGDWNLDSVGWHLGVPSTIHRWCSLPQTTATDASAHAEAQQAANEVCFTYLRSTALPAQV